MEAAKPVATHDRPPAGARLPPPSRLVQRSLLDPREPSDAVQRPAADSVNIPLSELPQRTHELPPRDRVIAVAAEPLLARQTVAWLESNGRRANAMTSFRHAAQPISDEIGRLWEPNAHLSQVLRILAGSAVWRGAPAADQTAPGAAVTTQGTRQSFESAGPPAALDLACGCGRDAVYLSSWGYDVTALDVLPDALARARELAGRCAAAIGPIRWVQWDLEAGEPVFDRSFDLVTIFFFLHRPLLRGVRGWLRPGASLLCETFTTLHRQRHGKPAREHLALRPAELLELCEGLDVRDYSEQWRGTAHTARIWALRT